VYVVDNSPAVKCQSFLFLAVLKAGNNDVTTGLSVNTATDSAIRRRDEVNGFFVPELMPADAHCVWLPPSKLTARQ
jgi:hypothetical protein